MPQERGWTYLKKKKKKQTKYKIKRSKSTVRSPCYLRDSVLPCPALLPPLPCRTDRQTELRGERPSCKGSRSEEFALPPPPPRHPHPCPPLDVLPLLSWGGGGGDGGQTGFRLWRWLTHNPDAIRRCLYAKTPHLFLSICPTAYYSNSSLYFLLFYQ